MQFSSSLIQDHREELVRSVFDENERSKNLIIYGDEFDDGSTFTSQLFNEFDAFPRISELDVTRIRAVKSQDETEAT